MQKFRNNHPRCWAIGMFVPLLLITFVIVPIGYLVEVVRDIPRVVSNLWGDLCSMFSEPFRQNWRVLKAWRLWFDALCGRESPTHDEKQTKESRKGKHLYTFDVPANRLACVSEAEVALEKAGCFDYRVVEGSLFYRIQYWSDRILLGWTTKEAKEEK